MRSILRLMLVLAIAGILAACSAAGGAAPATTAPTAAPAAATAVPSPTPYPTPKEVVASVAPVVMTDGEGDEVVTGIAIDTVQTKMETSTKVGDVTQVRGGEIAATHQANDVRASGQMTLAFSIDFYTKAGPLWATMKLTNDAGAWEGPCTGGSVGQGLLGPMSCWLAGSGAYEGWTYYQASRPAGSTATTVGIIYKGVPPTP